MMAHQSEDDEYWGPGVLDTARIIKKVKQKKFQKGSNSLLWGWEWVPGRWVKNFDGVEEGAEGQQKGQYKQSFAKPITEKTVVKNSLRTVGDDRREEARQFTVGHARNAPTKQTQSKSTQTTSQQVKGSMSMTLLSETNKVGSSQFRKLER